jgi:hypothetical protein
MPEKLHEHKTTLQPGRKLTHQKLFKSKFQHKPTKPATEQPKYGAIFTGGGTGLFPEPQKAR